MQEIQQALTTTSAAPAPGAALVPGADPDPNRGALRVYTDPLPDFSGNAMIGKEKQVPLSSKLHIKGFLIIPYCLETLLKKLTVRNYST